jgi:phospholipase/carboxylesterase
VTDPHRGQRVVQVGPRLGESDAAVIMVHGRNATPENILDLVGRLQRPRLTCFAPAAAGRSWYPESFLADPARNEPYLTSALAAVDDLVRSLVDNGCPQDRIVLLGFSQGACLASEYAYRHPLRYAGLVAFSGGLIGPPGTAWSSRGDFAGTPMFLGCSDVDAHVPRTRVDETASVFTRMGADVTERIYPGMGHLVSDDEIAAAREIFDRITA